MSRIQAKYERERKGFIPITKSELQADFSHEREAKLQENLKRIRVHSIVKRCYDGLRVHRRILRTKPGTTSYSYLIHGNYLCNTSTEYVYAPEAVEKLKKLFPDCRVTLGYVHQSDSHGIGGSAIIIDWS
jgi:hypothetical protein